MKFANLIIKYSFIYLFLFSNHLGILGLNSKLTIKQPPLADDQYRQANVPPALAVIFDVPAYSQDDLYKWTDFIQANTQMIAKNKLKNEVAVNQSYAERLKRIGLVKANIK
jgi:hypothetical protein